MNRGQDRLVPLDPAIVAAFAGAATATISDNLGRLPGLVGLQPFHRGGRLFGRALVSSVSDGEAGVQRIRISDGSSKKPYHTKSD